MAKNQADLLLKKWRYTGLKVLSLFDGISCGMVAFERAGIPVERYVAYEIDQNAIAISKKNYPMIEHCGDVFKADFTQYKGFDAVIGGSPCTWWSIAQKPGSREKTSSGLGWELFMQFVRAVKESGCKYFLYENNASMSDDIKEEITRQLGVEPIMIDSATVSAQSRKRLYWTNIPSVVQPLHKGITVSDILEPGADEINYIDKAVLSEKACITEKSLGPVRVGQINKGRQGERIYSIYGKTVTMMAGAGGLGAKTGLYLIGNIVRMLSITEAERAQTLPDGYTEGIPVSHRYKAIGNGWTVDVIVHILTFLP